MSRLPNPGSDEGQWGEILNDYLSQSHNTDGTLKAGIVGSAQLAAGAVTTANYADGSISTSKIQAGAVDTTHIADGAITTTKLATNTSGSASGLRSLLVFYSAPNIMNAQYNNTYAAGIMARYDDVVLGNGLANPSNTYYASTQAIIQSVAALSPSTIVWGYIDAGVTTSNLSLSAMQAQVDQWVAIGAKGIFLDAFGYDYQTSRSRQNSILSYVHGKGIGAIMNAWNSDDALGSAVNATYNPTGTATVAGASDVILLESWVCNSTSYASPYYATISDVKTRGDKAVAYRSSLGVRVFAINQMLNTGTPSATLQGYYDISEGMARCWRLNASGVSAALYSASGTDVGVVTPRFSSYKPIPLRTAGAYVLNGAWTQIQSTDLGITITYNASTSTYSWQQQ